MDITIEVWWIPSRHSQSLDNCDSLSLTRHASHLPILLEQNSILVPVRLVYATSVLAVALSYLQVGGRTPTVL
jgi:hypothetical protein